MSDNHFNVVIKKVKKGGHGGHHGGAWKVAYADFVTAMMAFFLLLWLLNATSEEQKLGISNYFDPTAISRSTSSGSGGVLGGQTVTEDGAMKNNSSPPSINDFESVKKEAPETNSPAEGSATSDDLESRSGARDGDGEAETQSFSDAVREATAGPAAGATDGDASEGGGRALEQVIAERQERAFAAAREKLESAIEKASAENPDLAEAAKSLFIESVEEGLRVQLVDQENVSFFPNGSAEMFKATRILLAKVAEIIKKMPNKMQIFGHTDATQFAPGSTYTHWELSADRALASRRALVDSGVGADRIVGVVGRADREPIVPDQPTSPTNRRISILLLRQTGDDAAAVTAARAELAARAGRSN